MTDAPAPPSLALGPDLAERAQRALAAKGPTYVARTRHKEPGGVPRYTNRLILETSPYLLQHAHNPVNWFPWGEEAFELAKRLGRPIFLSIGYSTCHWCHVMEEESFEDEEIAQYLNDHYVPIKVDREERPDVDSVYMASVQALTGRGGWPMSVWLTPEKKPFFGGTYFPPRGGARGASIGFLELLKLYRDAFSRSDAKLAQNTRVLAEHLERVFQVAGTNGKISAAVMDTAFARAVQRFDTVNGGTRGAPKFPSSLPLRLLLRHHRNTGSAQALDMAHTTLRKMSQGGMYDHVAGGFHRYSTDEHWLVPHFEKMLYDNALLVPAYLEGYQATQDPDLARVARETLDYVAREMTTAQGMFHSATDADSLGPGGHREEGYYFSWTPPELAQLLSLEERELVTAYYGVSRGGNFEGRSVLHSPKSRDDVAKELDLTRAVFDTRLASARERLRVARERRPAPACDDKVLASWNGLMLSAFARGAFVLDEHRYRNVASTAAHALLATLHVEHRLAHGLAGRKVSGKAFVDDYAFLAQGLLDTFELTGELALRAGAIELMNELEEWHLDSAQGGYFLSANDAEKLLAREKPDHDGALPSGNSVALMNQLRLAELSPDPVWQARAERTLGAFSSTLTEHPEVLSEMMLGVDASLGRTLEIVIVLPEGANDRDAAPLLAPLRRTFLPNRALLVAKETDLQGELGKLIPWAANKPARGNEPTAYLCERGACELPTSSPEVFGKQVAAVARRK